MSRAKQHRHRQIKKQPRGSDLPPLRSRIQTRIKSRISDADKALVKLFQLRRMQLGMSLTTLAKEIGIISAPDLRKIESGEMPLPLDIIFGLTNALSLDPQDVMNLIYDSRG